MILKLPCLIGSGLLCLSICLISVPVLAQTQKPIFPTTPLYPAGPASAAVVGDFNGDGQSDIAFISVGIGAPFAPLTVLLNQGDSNPPTSVTTSLNCSTQASLVAADMNNDKKLDLLLTCREGYVVVLLGNGDGTFQKPVYIAVTGATAVAPPVDLDGDGYLDVAVTMNQSNQTPTIAILLNQGTGAPGTLLPARNYPVPANMGAYGTGIGSGDFNGDGKQDILVLGADQLAVFYGNGDGTLQTAQTTPGGGVTFATGDFNHDGITDVAYPVLNDSDPANLTSQSLLVLLGSSTGQFTTGVKLPLSSSISNQPVITGNFNGDGNLDLAVVGGNTTIFLGDGKGGFAPGQTYALTGGPALAGAGASGKTDLLLFYSNYFRVLLGNGDGTFQGLPTLPIQNGFTTTDLNGDGLTDVLSSDLKGNLVTALGRGNGTFVFMNTIAGQPGELLFPGDFNGDGKVDVAAILPGSKTYQTSLPATDSQLFFYAGNADGTFQPSGTAIDLNIAGAANTVTNAVTGDFNGDTKLDIVVSFLTAPSGSSVPAIGLAFLPGKGDGTFGTPVLLSQQSSGSSGPLLTADLNNDRKLDLIWNNAAYLGNGDGTFKQTPLGLVGTPLALGDLSGDGIPDLVIGSSVYAGNGDGTFQASPFYIASVPQGVPVSSGSIGDVNADGNMDLLLQYDSFDNTANVAVFLGNGKGGFIADTNSYFAGNVTYASGGLLARLNNQAPGLPNDNALDFLTYSNGGATSLLNQINPLPRPPSPLPSKTILTASASSANVNQKLTFTATVSGINPTGSVAFVAGGVTLGTAAITNGTATLQDSFIAGTYAVTANYAGDNNNLSSASSAVSISVIAPDFTISASPSSATVKAGQSAVITLSIAPVGGYSGTVAFSCGPLPSEVTCSFSSSSITPLNGAAATTTITVSTTAATTAMLQEKTSGFLPTVAWASVLCLLLSPKRMWRSNRRLMRSGLVLILLGNGFIAMIGCNSASPSPAKPSDPGTPVGTQSVAISATDSSHGPQHSLSLQITVQ